MKKIFLAFTLFILETAVLASNLQQTVDFANVDPETLYNMYADPKEHKSSVKDAISAEIDAGRITIKFPGGGFLTGKIIAFDRANLRIIQTWRAPMFPPEAPDSILVLTFKKSVHGATLQMTQNNIPDELASTFAEHWYSYYWLSWKKKLKVD